jgi:hypothetical protein
MEEEGELILKYNSYPYFNIGAEEISRDKVLGFSSGGQQKSKSSSEQAYSARNPTL